MKRFQSLAVVLLLSLPLMVSAMQTEVVDLYYRSATDMTTLVQPHLDPGETVSGLGGKLVLRLKPENRARVLALVAELDKRPGQLLVSVRQGGSASSESTSAGVSGRVHTGRGGTSNIQGEISQSSASRDGSATQKVRVMDGQTAVFHVGHIVPAPAGTVVTQDGFVLHEGVAYQEVTTGFVVRPRLRGQQVLLEISPQSQSYNPDGTINHQSVHTTLEAALGQWVEIGSVVEQARQNNSGLLSAGRSSQQVNRSVEIMVERSR